MNQETLDQLSRTIHELAQCDPTTLAAVLAMLPDYMNGGATAVIGGAARIFAEHFRDNLDDSLRHFREIIENNIKEIQTTEQNHPAEPAGA